MGQRTCCLCACILLLAAGAACARKAPVFDAAVERVRVEQAIRASIGWAKNKDIELLYRVVSHGDDFLIVNPEERVVRGFDEFRQMEAFWMNEEFRAVRYDIRDLRISFSRSGTNAWYYCMLDDINEWKGKPANWENTRWTGVLEKQDGRWVIRQMHFSFSAK